MRKPTTTTDVVPIKIGDRFMSKNDGEFMVIKIETLKNMKSRSNITILWFDTHNINQTSAESILAGICTDQTKRRTAEYDQIYNSTSGPFIIIGEAPSINNFRMMTIKFLLTGTIKNVRWTAIYNDGKPLACVRDDYLPRIAGIGYIGDGSAYHPAYNIWEHMILRCYDPNNRNYCRYGALGVRVCDRWHCFKNFCDDLPLLPGYDKWVTSNTFREWHLDKDLLQQDVPLSQRVYSPTTCCFILARDNSVLTRNMQYLGVKALANGTYSASVFFDGAQHQLGIYPTLELAGAAYNHAVKERYPDAIVLNDVPNISVSELEKQRLDK